MTKAERDEAIRSAHLSYGYTLKEIADHLGIHSATASRAVAEGAKGKMYVCKNAITKSK